MKFNLRTIWAAIKEFRAVMAVINRRDELTLTEKADAFVVILLRLADRTATEIDNYVLGVIQNLIPQLTPLEQAYENRDAEQLFSATVTILSTVSSITDSTFDDNIVAYVESSGWIRTVAVAVIQRLIGSAAAPAASARDSHGRFICLEGIEPASAGGDVPYLEEMVADELAALQSHDTPFGSATEEDPNKNPMLILGITSVVLQLIRLWRDRKDKD